jgi:hypothetical protein
VQVQITHFFIKYDGESKSWNVYHWGDFNIILIFVRKVAAYMSGASHDTTLFKHIPALIKILDKPENLAGTNTLPYSASQSSKIILQHSNLFDVIKLFFSVADLADK